MTNILQSLSKTVHLSLGIAIALLLGLHFFGEGFAEDKAFDKHWQKKDRSFFYDHFRLFVKT